MDSLTIIWMALFVLGYGLVSKRLERTIITPPMIFVVLGLLFGDAARIDLRVLRTELVFNVVILTVLVSVFAHGMSAAPAAKRYGTLVTNEAHCTEEHKPV
ncbi:MAG: hypothetical protein WCF10_21600 [Polyangiales bacterium]